MRPGPFSFAVVTLLSALAALSPGGCARAGDAPTVRVQSGELSGAQREGVRLFAGIPYAQAPVGALRWRPPQAPGRWFATRDATSFGASCPQNPPPARTQPGAERTSEDCLTLNVWAPADSGAGHPVMVWIHGGGNTGGSGAGAFYDGTAFARDGVVLVTLNYRLGVLGFFAHPALTAKAGAEPLGNYALMDQIAALQWIRHNIERFGGDPKNITVFGESAGALDILALMATADAAQLFDRAIVESAPVSRGWRRLTEAEAYGVQVAARAGLTGAQATAPALRHLPLEALSPAQGEFDAIGMGPIIDGRLLREPPLVAFAQGRALHVPLIIGTNGNEGSLLRNDARAEAALADTTPSQFADYRAQYGGEASDDGTFTRVLFRDAHFAAPARWIAARQAGAAPTYLYRFDYVLSLLRAQRSGANHASEIPYVFDSWMTPRLSETDRNMTALLHACWIQFARSGAPSCAGVAQWPAYQAGHDVLLVLGEQVAAGPPAHAELLDALARRLLPPLP